MSFLKLRAAFIIARARLASFLKGAEFDRHIYTSLKKNQVECFSRSVYLQWLYVSAITDRDQARLVGLFEEFGLVNLIGGGRIYIATIESLIWLGRLDLASDALQIFKSISNSAADIEYLEILMSIKHGGRERGLFSTHGVPRSAVFENVYYYLKAIELDANDQDDALLYYQRCLRFISNGDYLYDYIVERCNTIRNR